MNDKKEIIWMEETEKVLLETLELEESFDELKKTIENLIQEAIQSSKSPKEEL